MRPTGSIASPETLHTLITRIQSLRPDSARQWGRMTPAQALCHLTDAFEIATGDRPAKAVDNVLTRTIIKVIAIRTPMPWPKGSPTSPVADAEQQGTRPGEFDADRQRLIEILTKFARPDATFGRHPFFGLMSREDWMKWAFGHTDHHLRQFGV